MFISSTEYGVYKYPHKRMENWRCYRIEYGGVNEDCFHECVIWLPPAGNIDEITELIEKWSREDGD